MKILRRLFGGGEKGAPQPVVVAAPAVVEVDREAWLRDLIGAEIDKVDADGRPILTALAQRLRDIDNLALNVKYFGYELAKAFAADLPPRPDVAFRHVGLASKPSTQADLESEWCAYWTAQLKVPLVFHRKLWELCYVLQALGEHGCMVAGKRGIGFGCGEEPIASLLASRDVASLVTDLAPDSAMVAGWQESNQYLSSRELAYKPDLVARDAFEALVTYASVDMNDIPADLIGFDFCWSVCALEHLGSIEKGMDFIVNSLKTLGPDGIAVHTTEFNFLEKGKTLDNWPTVLPQRAHFEALAARLRADGHWVAALDFDVGAKPLDRFIDIPPYPGDPSRRLELMGADADSKHLKLSIDGFASTCFGLIIRKAHG